MSKQKAIEILYVLILVLSNYNHYCNCNDYNFSIKEKPLVAVIASYNNNKDFNGKKRYKLNLTSVYNQDYDNYRVIYIDDNSNDGTADKVSDFVIKNNQQHRTTIIKNSKRWGPSRNRYVGSHLCNDDEIVLILDGDDMLIHSHVFKTINRTYQDPQTWLTYSHFKCIPGEKLSGGKQVPMRVIKNKIQRKYGWYYHSLKTYYAWLFKQVRLDDLLYEGNFFDAASDLAEMYPMVEMASWHAVFVPEVLYLAIQHSQNEINNVGNHKMAARGRYITSKKPYSPLMLKPNDEVPLKTDLLILARDNISNVNNLLAQLRNLTNGIERVLILNNSRKVDISNVYNPQLLTNDDFYDCNPVEEVKKLLNNEKVSYISLFSDNVAINSFIDFCRAIKYLKKSFGFCFNFALGKKGLEKMKVPLLNVIFENSNLENIYFFQNTSRLQYNLATIDFNASLYNKKDILNTLPLKITEPSDKLDNNNQIKNSKLILFHESPKVYNLVS